MVFQQIGMSAPAKAGAICDNDDRFKASENKWNRNVLFKIEEKNYLNMFGLPPNPPVAPVNEFLCSEALFCNKNA